MFRTAFSIFSVVLLLGVASDTGSAQPRGELDKQRLAQRQKRLDAFQAVCLDWHRKSIGLSDKTTDELKDAMNSLIEADQKVWNRQEDFQRFYFAGWASGAAYGLLNDKVKGASESKWVLIRDAILDESKKKELAQKLVARNERISDFAIDGLVGVFDQRLFLTDDQRKDVRKNLHRIVGRRLFYQPFVLYSEYGVRGLLDDEQFRRGLGPKATEVLRAGAGIKILRPRVQVKCMYIEPEEDRQRSLERAVASALFLLEDQVNQQIRVLKDRFSLNNADRKKLETAGKGILLRAERRWIASLSAQVKEMEERVRQRNKNVNTPMTLRTSVSGSLLEEPIWVNMVNRVALGKPPRREQSRRGMVSQMMAVLDRELWLMPDQVEPLKALVDKVVEDIHTTSIQRQAQQAHTEVMTIKNAEIDKVLTPNQMKVWQLLKDPKNIPVRRMERLGRRL